MFSECTIQLHLNFYFSASSWFAPNFSLYLPQQRYTGAADEINLVTGNQNCALALSFDKREAPRSLCGPPPTLLVFQPVLLLQHLGTVFVSCSADGSSPTRLNVDSVYSAFRPVGDEQTPDRLARGEISRRTQPRNRKSALQRRRDCTVDFYFRRLGTNDVHVTRNGGDSKHSARVFEHRSNDTWRH